MLTESGNRTMDHSKIRRTSGKDDLELNAAGQALLASIEESTRPKELAAAFPRIVNRIASLWKSPRQMDRYFEELLTDNRGGRRGFPLGILMELTALKEYYQTKVFPFLKSDDVWQADAVAKRKL